MSADKLLFIYTATPPPLRPTRWRRNSTKPSIAKWWSRCYFFRCVSVMTAMSTLYPIISAVMCSTACALVMAAALKTYREGASPEVTLLWRGEDFTTSTRTRWLSRRGKWCSNCRDKCFSNCCGNCCSICRGNLCSNYCSNCRGLAPSVRLVPCL